MRRQIDTKLLEMALVGLSAKRDEITRMMADIEQQLGGGKNPSAAAAPSSVAPKPRRTMSAAGRARIAEGQRKRWAQAKRKPSVVQKETAKPKRRLSAAGRAAIIAATKKRWALKRAEAAKAG